VADLGAANAFLEAEYWADHNARFAISASSADDFHVARPRGLRLDTVFRLEEERTVSNDWVVRYDNRCLQLARQSGLPPARETVLVREDVDGQIEIRYRDRALRWREIARPVAAAAAGARSSARPRPAPVGGSPVPCADHPWRHAVENHFIGRQLAAERRARAAVEP